MHYFSKTYRQRIIWATVIPAITAIFFSIAAASVEQQIANQYIKLFFYANDPQTEFAMILSMIVYFVFLCCLTGIFTDDLQIQITYCFTRKKNIMKWYFSMTGLLLLLSVISVLSYTLCGSIIIFILGNYSFSVFFIEINVLLKIIILVWLFVFCISFFINVIALFIKKKYIMPVMTVILSALAACLPFSIEKEKTILMSVNPIARLNASLHTDILNTAYFEDYANGIDVNLFDLKFGESVFYFIFLSAIAFVIGIIAVKKTDIAMKTEE